MTFMKAKQKVRTKTQETLVQKTHSGENSYNKKLAKGGNTQLAKGLPKNTKDTCLLEIFSTLVVSQLMPEPTKKAIKSPITPVLTYSMVRLVLPKIDNRTEDTPEPISAKIIIPLGDKIVEMGMDNNRPIKYEAKYVVFSFPAYPGDSSKGPQRPNTQI